MGGRIYSGEDLETLLEYVQSDLPVSVISERLGRSAEGICQKLSSLLKTDPAVWDNDHVRAYVKEYRQELIKKHYQKHPEKKREYRRNYRENHPEKIREEKRRYRKKHPEKRREEKRRYRQENPDKIREYNEKRRERYRNQRNGNVRTRWNKHSIWFVKYERGKLVPFGNTLREIIADKGLKKDVAGKIGITAALLSDYLRGDVRPSKFFIWRVSTLFGVPSENLESALEEKVISYQK